MSEEVICESCGALFEGEKGEGKKNECLTCEAKIEPMPAVKKGAKKAKIFIITLLVFLLSLGGYAFFVGGESKGGVGIFESIKNKISETVSGDKDVNYSFFMDMNLEGKTNDQAIASSKISLKNGEIISNNGGLKQKIKIDSIVGSIYSEDENLSIKNLEIISDEEKVYVKNWDELKNIIDSLTQGSVDISSMENIGDGENAQSFTLINNSKPLLKVFGELAKNELMKEFLIGSVTSNPNSYYKKHGIDTKLQAYLKSDAVLDYLFVEGEQDSTTNKTFLMVNSNICTDYAPVVVAAMNDITGDGLVGDASESMITECETGITQLNQILPMLTQIYKEGGTEKGDFKLVIAQGNMLDIALNYKKHSLDTWVLSMAEPNGKVSLKANGDSSGITGSKLSLNVDESGMKINGEIIDGTGTIALEGKQEGMYEVKGTIAFAEYKLSSYDIKGDGGMMGMKAHLIAKGTLEAGLIDFLVQAPTSFSENPAEDTELEEMAKLKLSYEGLNYDFEAKTKQVEASSHYKNSDFALNYKEKDYNGDLKTSLDLTYNNGMISGKLKEGSNDVVVDGNFESYRDFKLSLNNGNDSVIISAEASGVDTLNYNVDVINNSEKEISGVLSINKSHENNFEVFNIDLDYKFYYGVNREKIDSITFSGKLGLQEGGASYEIPTEYTEGAVKIDEILTLPDFSSVKHIDASNKTLIIGGVTAGAVLGTVGFISLQGYSADARNSKRYSDIRNIVSKMEIEMVSKGTPIQSFIISDSKYEEGNVIVGGKTLTLGEDYFVGTPNYDALGMMKSDLLDPDGSEYIIAATTRGSAMYQVFSIQENSNGNSALLIGNYYQKNTNKVLKKDSDYTFLEKGVIKLKPSYFNIIKKGDIINKMEVMDVTDSGTKITFDKEFIGSILIIRADSKGLFSKNGKILENGDYID